MYIDDVLEKLIKDILAKSTMAYSLLSKAKEAEQNHGTKIVAVYDAAEEKTLTATIKNSFAATPTEEVRNDVPPKYKDGSFRQKKSGLLEYRFMHLDKRISVYGYSENECFAKRTEVIMGKVPKTNKKIPVKEQTYGEWLLYWYELYKKPNISEAHAENMKSNIDKRLIPALGEIPLNNIDTEDLQKYLNAFNGGSNTKSKVALIINESLQKAVNARKISYNPFCMVSFKKHKPENYNTLQFEEQQKVYESIDNEKYKILFMVCCCTGTRISELLLSIPHFDFKNHVIAVVNEDTSTKKHKRLIPFLPELIDEKKQELLAKITLSGAEQYFAKLSKKIGIRAMPHTFRHTFISVCNYLNINIKQIQLWAGHSSIKMTMDTYTEILRHGESVVLEYLLKLKEFLKL